MQVTKFYTENIEYQMGISFILGFLFAPFSWGISYTLYFVIIFEVYVFLITANYPPQVKGIDRVLINLFFFVGWFISRIIFCNETGCEEALDRISKMY
jgi:hypothetical protein